MEDAAIVLHEKNPSVSEEKYCVDKLALLGCCTPSVVFDNTTVVRDAELAGSEDSSSEDREEQENVMVRLDKWNASNALAVENKNLVVLLHHALKQGLTFKLQGLGLRHVLGRTAKSTPLLLASFRLTNFVKGGKGHCNAGHKRENLNSGFKLGSNKAAINRDNRITSPRCSLEVLDQNELHMAAQNHCSLKPCPAPLREVSICNNERSLQLYLVNLEALPFQDGQIQYSSSTPSRIPASSVPCSMSLNEACEALGHATSCLHHVDAETASKQLLSEIMPDHAGSDQFTGHAILPQHNSNKELKHTVSTRVTNAEITQDTPRSTKDELGGKPTCQMSHGHSNYFQPEIDHSLPDCNFNTRPDSAPNVFPSEPCLKEHRNWFEQSAKLQARTEASMWPNQNLEDSWNVKSGFSDSCLPRTLNHFWLHSPAGRYQHTPEKYFSSHCNSSTCRFNPLAQSCPSVVQPFFHLQCQHTHGGHHPNSSRVMGFPEHGKLSAAALCSPCLSSREMFPGSTPVCEAQNNSVIQSYQCPSPAVNDSFKHPSDLYAGPSNSEPVQLDDRRGPPSSFKPKKLLWLSEEEAEIIRLIRLSQFKDLSRCSSSYHASEQASPVLSARMGHDIQDEVNLNETRDVSHFSSRVSSSSMEDFTLKAAEAGTHNLGYMETDCILLAEGDQPILIDADCTILVCNEKQMKKEDAGHEQRAASCIQHFWRMHTERRNNLVEEKKRLEALKFIFEMPATQEHLLQMAVSAMKNGQLVSWHASICRAAKVIQCAWQEALTRKKEIMLAPKTLPQELKELYKLIFWRHTNKGFAPPTYERFVRLMERLQAITEGARIRRRLKSRRLQTIVKEIREIRLVLQELSGEAGQEPSLNLLPQLSTQLQQKLLQLQTALSGPQDAARVLLRRCPATPLVLCSSKNVQAEVTGFQSSSVAGDSGSQAYPSGKSSNESFTGSQKPAVIGPALGKFATESFTGSQKSKHGMQARRSSLSDVDIHGKYQSSTGSDLQPPSLLSSEIVQSKSDGSEVQLDPAKDMIELMSDKNKLKSKIHVEKASGRGHFLEATVNNGSKENNAVSKSEHAVELWQSNTFLSFPEKTSDISSVKSSSLNMEDSDYEDMSQSLDVPKHPFLRRKSKAMHPQKLDWSKVKPMVSSRLEPELKTRLLKAKFRGTALFRKRNFSQIKSRLFSYEKSGSGHNHDTMRDSKFGHGGAETKEDTEKNRSSIQEYAALEFEPNKASLNVKVHKLKQPSLRYFPDGISVKDDTKKISGAESERGCVSRKLREKMIDEYLEVDPSCKRDQFVSFENQLRSQGHSKRYGSPKKQPDRGSFEKSSSAPTNYENSRPTKRADLLFSNHVEQPLSELEKMFDGLVVRQGREVSLATYFGSSQQDSIIPRLYPNSNVFEASRQKMSQIHQLLSKEGCAGRLQHNCLSFVSIRD